MKEKDNNNDTELDLDLELDSLSELNDSDDDIKDIFELDDDFDIDDDNNSSEKSETDSDDVELSSNNLFDDNDEDLSDLLNDELDIDEKENLDLDNELDIDELDIDETETKDLDNEFDIDNLDDNDEDLSDLLNDELDIDEKENLELDSKDRTELLEDDLEEDLEEDLDDVLEEEDFNLEKELGILDDNDQEEHENKNDETDVNFEDLEEYKESKEKELESKESSSESDFYEDLEEDTSKENSLYNDKDFDFSHNEENNKDNNALSSIFDEKEKDEDVQSIDLASEYEKAKNNKTEENEPMNDKVIKESPAIDFVKGTIIGTSLLCLLSIGGYGVLFKDEIISKINGKTPYLQNIEESQSLIAKNYVDKENFDKTLNNIKQLEKTVQELRVINEKLEKIANEQQQKQKLLENNLSEKTAHLNQLKGLLVNNENEMKKLKEQSDSQKELLAKAVKITLGIIDENKEINKKNAEDIYNKVFSKLKTNLENEKSKLYDFSILEERLSNAMSSKKEILAEMQDLKKENIRIRGELSKVDAKLKEVTIDKQANESSVLELLNENPKSKKIEKGIEISKSKSSSKSSAPTYHIVGIVEGVAYILPEGARSRNDVTPYKVGDFIQGYGRIVRITDNQIISEKGVVRKK